VVFVSHVVGFVLPRKAAAFGDMWFFATRVAHASLRTP
jgi:hypothetical protein